MMRYDQLMRWCIEPCWFPLDTILQPRLLHHFWQQCQLGPEEWHYRQSTACQRSCWRFHRRCCPAFWTSCWFAPYSMTTGWMQELYFLGTQWQNIHNCYQTFCSFCSIHIPGMHCVLHFSCHGVKGFLQCVQALLIKLNTSFYFYSSTPPLDYIHCHCLFVTCVTSMSWYLHGKLHCSSHRVVGFFHTYVSPYSLE